MIVVINGSCPIATFLDEEPATAAAFIADLKEQEENKFQHYEIINNVDHRPETRKSLLLKGMSMAIITGLGTGFEAPRRWPGTYVLAEHVMIYLKSQGVLDV